MKISIEYCSVWNYLPRASSLEAELKSKFEGVGVELISSGGGVFEVTLDGDLIFSKRSLDRFPEDGEIEKLIRQNTDWINIFYWLVMVFFIKYLRVTYDYINFIIKWDYFVQKHYIGRRVLGWFFELLLVCTSMMRWKIPVDPWCRSQSLKGPYTFQRHETAVPKTEEFSGFHPAVHTGPGSGSFLRRDHGQPWVRLIGDS